jgi:hypothetical protein
MNNEPVILKRYKNHLKRLPDLALTKLENYTLKEEL